MPATPAEVKIFIETHLTEIAGPRCVAAGLGCCYETLRRRFSRETGITLGVHINQVRVARMQRLLAETDLTCREIYLEVGLTREDTASKLFKRLTGMTMTVHRERHPLTEE